MDKCLTFALTLQVTGALSSIFKCSPAASGPAADLSTYLMLTVPLPGRCSETEQPRGIALQALTQPCKGDQEFSTKPPATNQTCQHDAFSLHIHGMRACTPSEHQEGYLHEVRQENGPCSTSGHDRQHQRSREDQGQQGEEGTKNVLCMRPLFLRLSTCCLKHNEDRGFTLQCFWCWLNIQCFCMANCIKQGAESCYACISLNKASSRSHSFT